jgi:hypothetical protein
MAIRKAMQVPSLNREHPALGILSAIAISRQLSWDLDFLLRSLFE